MYRPAFCHPRITVIINEETSTKIIDIKVSPLIRIFCIATPRKARETKYARSKSLTGNSQKEEIENQKSKKGKVKYKGKIERRGCSLLKTLKKKPECVTCTEVSDVDYEKGKVVPVLN
jgi:hypothetical protein